MHVDRQALGRGEEAAVCRERCTQEKSCAVLSTPERAVRNSVFAIFRAIALDPGGEDRHAHTAAAGRDCRLTASPFRGFSFPPCHHRCQRVTDKPPLDNRVATAPGSITTVVKRGFNDGRSGHVISGLHRLEATHLGFRPTGSGEEDPPAWHRCSRRHRRCERPAAGFPQAATDARSPGHQLDLGAGSAISKRSLWAAWKAATSACLSRSPSNRGDGNGTSISQI